MSEKLPKLNDLMVKVNRGYDFYLRPLHEKDLNSNNSHDRSNHDI